MDTNEDDLIQTSIDRFPTSWNTFLVVVNGREENPNFEIIWHDCIQEEGHIQNKMVSTKDENNSLMERTKKERKPFYPNNTFRAKNKEIHKGMDKSKLIRFYCKKVGHFIRDCNARKRKEGRVHASTAIEGGEPSQEKSSKE